MMTMKRSIAFFILVVFITACKKNQLGGNATIEGTVKHHTKVITKATVFIKFNVEEFPGGDTALYDDKVRVDKDGNFKFEVYKGKYYVYAFGYDYNIPSPFHVVGGVPVSIRSKEDVSVIIPVTEGD